MQTDISPETFELLKASGWSPDRSVDIDPIVSILEAHHYTVYPAVKAFLREFYGIRIKHRDPSRKGLYHLIFDPEWVLNPLTKHRSRLQYELEVSGLTCPIAKSHDYEALHYLMDKAGKVYQADHYEGFSLVGNDILSAIDWVLNDRPQEREIVLAPFNEFRIYDILTNSRVIATMGHTNSTWAHRANRGGYDIDHFLREKGYEVYTIQPHRESIDDTIDDNFIVFASLDDVPKSVEILVCLSFEYMQQAVHDAQHHKIDILFPAYSNFDSELTKTALSLGVEHIEGLDIRDAYKHVIEGNLFKSE